MTFDRDGFLTEEVRHRHLYAPATRPWFVLAERLNRAIHRHLSRTQSITIRDETFATLIVNLLYFRALSNFQGAILMAERGLIVEARTLTRSLGEAALCMVGADVDPAHFESLRADYETSRKGRAKILARNPDWLNSPDQRARIASLVESQTKKGQLSGYMDYATIAQKADCEIHYIIFRELSADAAHASLESLQRYFETSSDGATKLNTLADDSPALINETVDVLCNFMFLATATFLKHAAEPGHLDEVIACWELYRELASKRSQEPDAVPHVKGG